MSYAGHGQSPETVRSRIDMTQPGCWEWPGYITAYGYGSTSYQGRLWLAHRLVYELEVGPVPYGLQLDHLCLNRACVRPDHLEPVTNLENARRGVRATRAFCNSGHEYTPENVRRSAAGHRVCLACRKIVNRKTELRRQAERRAAKAQVRA